MARWRHPEELSKCAAAHGSSISPERRELLNGRGERISEALRLLRQNSQGKLWYIFEGETQPDVYIEASDIIVVVEGKRTEPGPTTHTTWMPKRHQMLRHIDCAWETHGKKKLAGLFIVEGENGSEEVPNKWQQFAKETTSRDAIGSSLPHRGPEEQREIAACFAGVTTWQRVCREFGINLASLPQTAPEQGG